MRNMCRQRVSLRYSTSKYANREGAVPQSIANCVDKAAFREISHSGILISIALIESMMELAISERISFGVSVGVPVARFYPVVLLILILPLESLSSNQQFPPNTSFPSQESNLAKAPFALMFRPVLPHVPERRRNAEQGMIQGYGNKFKADVLDKINVHLPSHKPKSM